MIFAVRQFPESLRTYTQALKAGCEIVFLRINRQLGNTQIAESSCVVRGEKTQEHTLNGNGMRFYLTPVAALSFHNPVSEDSEILALTLPTHTL